MERLTKEAIRRALEALAAALPPGAAPRELWVVGGAALVLLNDGAKGYLHGLAPGELLKAQYAFDDLWEADRGPA